jgi:hypothetical protein
LIIKIHYFLEHLLVFLHTILQDARYNHQNNFNLLCQVLIKSLKYDIARNSVEQKSIYTMQTEEKTDRHNEDSSRFLKFFENTLKTSYVPLYSLFARPFPSTDVSGLIQRSSHRLSQEGSFTYLLHGTESFLRS